MYRLKKKIKKKEKINKKTEIELKRLKAAQKDKEMYAEKLRLEMEHKWRETEAAEKQKRK